MAPLLNTRENTGLASVLKYDFNIIICYKLGHIIKIPHLGVNLTG